MNRVQKKCMIGSVALHLVLLAVLVLGPGFFMPARTVPDAVILEVIPDLSRVTDAPTTGGNRNAPPPQPVVQQPPQPTVRPTPEPPRPVRPEPVKVNNDDPDTASPVRRPRINTTLVNRPNTSTKTPQPPRNQTASDINKAISNIRTAVSPSTKVDTDFGPGDGGALMANYRDLVASIYEAAWIPPEDAASDAAVTTVSVTISSDGSVVTWRINRASGDAQVDASVKRTLEQVKRIAPFPKGAKDKERTYTINFDLKAKRSA